MVIHLHILTKDSTITNGDTLNGIQRTVVIKEDIVSNGIIDLILFSPY